MIKKKLLLLGSTGLLGKTLHKVISKKKYEVIGVARSNADYEIDLSNPENILKLLESFDPDIVINAAAMINILDCENYPDSSWRINTLPLVPLTEWSRKLKKPIIHISTDHFYDYGNNFPHKEEDILIFKNNYAMHKYCAEKFALNSDFSLILRTSFTGRKNDGENQTFWEWALSVVDEDKEAILFEDAFTSVLDVGTFAKSLIQLMEKNIYGLFNVSSSEVFSKLDFVETLAKQRKRKLSKIEIGSVHSLETKRANCLGLDSSKVQQELDFKLPPMKEVIKNLILSEEK